MRAALCELVIEGITVNTDIFLDILDEDMFLDGSYGTDFMEQFSRREQS